MTNTNESSVALSPEHVRILESFAEDTGACRLNNKQAADLAAACAAAVKLNAALARINATHDR